MFDKVWMKLSQAIAVIEEEVPRMFSNKDKVPLNTIKIFIVETWNELYDFNTAMQYVENFDKIWWLEKPEWFIHDPDITDEELEDEIMNLQEYKVEAVENYDSFIERLRGDVRAHTNSFIEIETKRMSIEPALPKIT